MKRTIVLGFCFTLLPVAFRMLQAAPLQRKKMTTPTFDLQGHRGCRGLMPENTIPAMIRALELGATTLEMDIAITADSVCILSHEPFFNHEITTLPGGQPVSESDEQQLNIFRMTAVETNKYDVGQRPHPRFPEQQKMPAVKPRLSEVFSAVRQWCRAHRRPLPFFNIETKTQPATDGIFHPGPEAFVDLLMADIQKAQMSRRTIIQSFDFRTLQVVHRKYPGTATAALLESDNPLPLPEVISRLGFVPDIYSPHYRLVNEAAVRACREKGIRIIPWTVNDLREAERLKKLGVDGWITDYPDRIRN